MYALKLFQLLKGFKSKKFSNSKNKVALKVF